LATAAIIPSDISSTGIAEVEASELLAHPLEVSGVSARIKNTSGIHHLAAFELLAQQGTKAQTTSRSLVRRVTVLGPGFINSHLR
jgi:PIN domain nuclease of toxin-antitoxin system